MHLKTKNKLKNFLANDVLCIFLLLSAIIFEFLYTHTPLFIPSLTSLGRLNIYGTRDLTFIWQVIITPAILLNIFRLYLRSQLDKTTLNPVAKFLFFILSVLGIYLCFVSYTLIVNFSEKLSSNYSNLLNVFMILSIIYFLSILIIKSFKSIKYFLFTLIFLLFISYSHKKTVIDNESNLLNYMLLPSLIFLLFLNFLNFFKPKKIKENQSDENQTEPLKEES